MLLLTCGEPCRYLPYTGDDSFDDAITAAKAAGFRIAGIQATRGLLPAQDPSRKEGLDGNRNA